jgi:hypothetical protein
LHQTRTTRPKRRNLAVFFFLKTKTIVGNQTKSGGPSSFSATIVPFTQMTKIGHSSESANLSNDVHPISLVTLVAIWEKKHCAIRLALSMFQTISISWFFPDRH